jgi:hypothetical protein
MSQPQTTINISDLDIAQLSEVRKQLEEVSCLGDVSMLTPFHLFSGTQSPHKLLRPAEASPGKV